MSRYIYQGTYKDGNGKVVTSGTISVFEAGTSNVANIYLASTGGSAINSVTSDSTNGSFVFYVDDGDYAEDQTFKLTLSKTDYQSKSYDDIVIFPHIALHYDNLFILRDNIDPTKRIRFHLDSISTGQTRVMTIPNGSDTLVGNTITAILSNKTIDKLTLTQVSASGAAPVCSMTQSDIDDTFIDFVGTSAADGTRSISSDTTEDSSKFGAIRIEINGVTKWIRIYDNES